MYVQIQYTYICTSGVVFKRQLIVSHIILVQCPFIYLSIFTVCLSILYTKLSVYISLNISDCDQRPLALYHGSIEQIQGVSSSQSTLLDQNTLYRVSYNQLYRTKIYRTRIHSKGCPIIDQNTLYKVSYNQRYRT